MAIKQLTVFVPNRKGSIVAVTDILAKNNINMRALSIAETEDFGILRLIVNDENTAEKVLEEQGYLIKVVDVVGVKIGDAPGKLTAALDVLEDTSWAVEFYVSSDYPDDFRGKYLYTYGLQQALFVQMDAIRSVHEALFGEQLDFKSTYLEAYIAREMRDDVTGHPTNRKGSEFIHLAQQSMSKSEFYYIKFDSKKVSNEYKIITVDVNRSIEDVAKCINDTLKKAVERLDLEFRDYIDSHKERKMKDIFNMLQYYKGKVLSDAVRSLEGYSATKNMVKKCEDELVLRYGSPEALDSYKYLLEEIHEIYDLIDEGILKSSNDIRTRLKKYLLQILFVKLEELQRYCNETDEYFENYGESPRLERELPQVNIIYNEEVLNTEEMLF